MIKVFIGTNELLHKKAERVLEYSILKHASMPVEIEFMRPGWLSGCTTFTNHRFLIPSLCDYQGYAIYFDVDMLLLGDIADLWSRRTPGMWCTTAMRDDVAVIDCDAFRDITAAGVKGARKDAIRRQIGARRLLNIPAEWNCIDSLAETTKLLHYSDLDRQPWHPIPGHPYKEHPDPAAVELFWNYYAEAMGE